MLPVAHDRCGTDEKCRTLVLKPLVLKPLAVADCAFVEQERDDFYRLAQSHVVGQARAQSHWRKNASHDRPPTGKAAVCHEIHWTQAGARFCRWSFAASGRRASHLPRPRSRASPPPGWWVRATVQSARPLAARVRLPLDAFPEFDGLLNLIGSQLDPLAAHLNKRHFERRQLFKLVRREHLAAQGQSPVVFDDGLERQACHAAFLL